jgi:hypothetical protein
LCKICLLEGRKASQETTYCSKHDICLCDKIFKFTHPSPVACTELKTCWEKFHDHYQKKYRAYSRDGSIIRKGPVYELYQQRKTFGSYNEGEVRSVARNLFHTTMI